MCHSTSAVCRCQFIAVLIFVCKSVVKKREMQFTDRLIKIITVNNTRVCFGAVYSFFISVCEQASAALIVTEKYPVSTSQPQT